VARPACIEFQSLIQSLLSTLVTWLRGMPRWASVGRAWAHWLAARIAANACAGVNPSANAPFRTVSAVDRCLPYEDREDTMCCSDRAIASVRAMARGALAGVRFLMAVTCFWPTS